MVVDALFLLHEKRWWIEGTKTCMGLLITTFPCSLKQVQLVFFTLQNSFPKETVGQVYHFMHGTFQEHEVTTMTEKRIRIPMANMRDDPVDRKYHEEGRARYAPTSHLLIVLMEEKHNT